MPERKTVKDYVRTIVDFPEEGIMFRDVTTLLADPRGFRMAIDQLKLALNTPGVDNVQKARDWGLVRSNLRLFRHLARFRHCL